MKDVFDLEDWEIEECFDGSSNVDMVREILEKDGVLDDDGSIIVEEFAQWFAYAIEGYIDADEETEEWDEAWNNNFEWGKTIAENLNDYLNMDV